MTTIFRTIFGSRLYGTANENSDYDVKSVYLPDLEGCLVKMQNFTSRHREFVKDGIKYDCEDIPLQSFLKMASEGQTIAYDMLFSPKDKWLPDEGEDFGFWENVILPARDRFISRKCVNFLGYAIGQALKYGNKGKKLKQYEEAVKRLSVISDKSAPAQNYANMLIDGDLIKIDIPARKIELCVDESEISARKSQFKAPEPKENKGWLAKYSKIVQSASTGAITKYSF